MKSTIKSYFVKGLLIWVPVLVTVFIVKMVLNLMGQLSKVIPEQWLEVIPYSSLPGFNIVFALSLIIATGVVGSHFIGKLTVRGVEAVVKRLPLIGTIYYSVKKVLTVMFNDQSRAFQQVVMVEYPRKGCYSLGFVTSDSYKDHEGKTLVTVLIVTTPNPTSGFVLLLPKDQVRVLDMSVEEGLRYVISLGTVYEQTQ
ncbi:MAG TPA: DUF502 domain-containing protein [Gammaproteobacteria bacterium]|nr:DUF502 domain-containing protein [Gammaproteobacteria bacterium]